MSTQDTARWYCVDSIGLATLCRDEDDAKHVADERSIAWPATMPCRAVQLGDVGALVAERDKFSAESASHFVRAREWAERSGVLESERNQARADVAELVEALTALLDSDTGRQTMYRIDWGQGTQTNEGLAWLPARALLAKHKEPA